MNSSAKIFVLLVCASPYTHQSADSAFHFAKALLGKGHIIGQVFFYFDGVYVSSSYVSPEQSERKITLKWSELAQKNNLNLVVCSNSAMKRGMLDEKLSKKEGKSGYNLDHAFKMAGLGQFVEAAIEADRIVTFGA